jgi:glycine/D-amino acid oxidase-like deaminating enzyme
MDTRASIPPGIPRQDPTESYWQSPPDPIALEGSTSDIPTSADFVIVGSGISGALIAWNILHRSRNASIVMFEAREASSGASGRNGGHTKAASYRTFRHHADEFGIDEAIKIAKLEYQNIVDTHKFAEDHDIACESRPCDTLDVIYDKDAFEDGLQAIELMQRHLGKDGAGRYEVFQGEQAEKVSACPGLDVAGVVKYQAGSISAYKFTIGVLKLCAAMAPNFHLRTNSPVIQIKNDNGHWIAVTKRGQTATQSLILATNGYAAHLLPELQAKIVPLRGQVTAQKPGPKLSSLKPNGLETTYSFIYRTGYEYMVQRPFMPSIPTSASGDVIIGGGLARLPQQGLDEYGNTDDTGISPENSAYLKETLTTYFGSNWGSDEPDSRVKREWTGIMGATSDGLPYVGELPDRKGLWISAGFNGHGTLRFFET